MSVLADRASGLRGSAAVPAPRFSVVFAVGAAGAVGIATAVALSSPGSGDYFVHGPVSGDNAGPGLDSLADGNLGAFASHQPLMGLTSLLLRLPLVALGSAFGSSDLTVYRLGALACLLPCALFAAWLIAERRSSLVGLASGALAAYVLLLAPTTIVAVHSGHPEEPLAAVLAAASVLAAIRGRSGVAGVLLGIAIGTKEWTLLAAAPVLMALPGRRARAVALALAASLLLVLPPMLANPAAFGAASRSLGATHLVNALSAWWPLSGRPANLPAGAPLVGELPSHLSKSSALAIALGLTLAAAGAALLTLRHRGKTRDAMALLALLGLVRCLADPGPVEYYYVALLVPLVAWEVAVIRRLPIVTALALGGVSIAFGPATRLPAGELSALMLAGSTALGAYLTAQAFALKRARRTPITASCER